MQLKPVQRASRSSVSNTPARFCNFRGKQNCTPFFCGSSTPKKLKSARKSDLAFKSYGSQFGDVSHPTKLPCSSHQLFYQLLSQIDCAKLHPLTARRRSICEDILPCFIMVAGNIKRNCLIIGKCGFWFE